MPRGSGALGVADQERQPLANLTLVFDDAYTNWGGLSGHSPQLRTSAHHVIPTRRGGWNGKIALDLY